MFSNKKEALADRSVKAFLEYGCEFEGKLTFSGVVRVNGRLKGDIHSESCLIVGETAEIDGILHVGSMIVGGKITGDIIAKERVEIQATGSIKGKLRTPILVMHEGAQIEGDISVSKSETRSH